MLPILQLGQNGGIILRTPGLALLAGLWLALEIASREGVRLGLDENHTYNLGFLTLLGGVLGARLGFVLLNLPLYTSITPWTRALTSVLALAPGTEIAWLGLLVAAGIVWYFLRNWHLDPLDVADAFAPALAVFAAGIGLANLLSGDYYGTETGLFWGINLWGARRHPTQVYFMLASVVIFIVLWRMRTPRVTTGRRGGTAPQHRRAAPGDRQPGLAAQTLVILFGLSLLLIEPLRADSPVILGTVRLWSVIGLLGLIGGLASFAYRPPRFAGNRA